MLETQAEIEDLVYQRSESERKKEISSKALCCITFLTLYYWIFFFVDSWTDTLINYSILLWHSRFYTFDYPTIAVLFGFILSILTLLIWFKKSRLAVKYYAMIFLLDGLIPILIRLFTYKADPNSNGFDIFLLIIVLSVAAFYKFFIFRICLLIPSSREFWDSANHMKIRQEVNQQYLDEKSKITRLHQ